MSELSKYIHKELNTILTHIHKTPSKRPKTSASLQHIRRMVNEAPMPGTHKKSIEKSIRKIESAMSGRGKLRVEGGKQPKNPYTKNLFFENMFLEEKNLNLRHRPSARRSECSQDEYHCLMDKLKDLRQLRIKREDHLAELVVKSQRLERLISLKLENEDKYLKSKQLSKGREERVREEEELMEKTREAASSNRRKTVHSLMSKYNNFMMN